MRRIAVLDAPSNLGLRPPTGSSVPGCAKAPGALRDHGLLARLGALDAGCLTAPRYDLGDWQPGDGVAHAQAIAMYSVRLADRIGEIIDAGEFPLVLGGDCSIVIGSAFAMRRMASPPGPDGSGLRDGHSTSGTRATPRTWGPPRGGAGHRHRQGPVDLAAIEHRRPYLRRRRVLVDPYPRRLPLTRGGRIASLSVPRLRAEGRARWRSGPAASSPTAPGARRRRRARSRGDAGRRRPDPAASRTRSLSC
jgi:arginase